MSSCFPDGCGCEALDIEANDPSEGDFDEVLHEERTSAKAAIDKQYELACDVFAIQKDLGDHWKANQAQWNKDVYSDRLNRRSINDDVEIPTLLSRYGGSLDKTTRAAKIGLNNTYQRYGVYNNPRISNTTVITDVDMVGQSAKAHGVHHLIKHELNRYYVNDDAGWEALIAAHHGSAPEPSAIFALLGNAQATYSTVASAAITQQQRSSVGGGGNKLFGAVIGGVTGFFTGGYVGAAVGAVKGYASA